MVGELETALKGPPGNATMEIGGVLVAWCHFSFDGQCIVFNNDVDVLVTKTGNGKGDAILIVRCFGDVVGGVRDMRVVVPRNGVENTG